MLPEECIENVYADPVMPAGRGGGLELAAVDPVVDCLDGNLAVGGYLSGCQECLSWHWAYLWKDAENRKNLKFLKNVHRLRVVVKDFTVIRC